MSFAMNLRRGSAAAPAEPTLSPSSAQADCVAFIADPLTHGTVTQLCQPVFPGLQIQQGGAKEAVDYLAAGAPPKILIVDVSDSNKPLSAMLPIIAAFAEDTRVIAIGALNDIELYREMIEAGISDYLVKPVSEKALSIALDRAEQRKAAPAAAPEPEAKVVPDAGKRSLVAVMGTRGGVGASTVAMNLAWLMANDHKRDTMLVDLDLQGGTIALALDVEPSHGLREVLDNPARIDSLFLTSVATKFADRLHVLAAEEAVDDEVHYNTSAVSLLLDELKKTSTSVIVDLPRNAPGARAVVLAAATEIIIVTDLTLGRPARRHPPPHDGPAGGAQRPRPLRRQPRRRPRGHGLEGRIREGPRQVDRVRPAGRREGEPGRRQRRQAGDRGRREQQGERGTQADREAHHGRRRRQGRTAEEVVLVSVEEVKDHGRSAAE